MTIIEEAPKARYFAGCVKLGLYPQMCESFDEASGTGVAFDLEKCQMRRVRFLGWKVSVLVNEEPPKAVEWAHTIKRDGVSFSTVVTPDWEDLGIATR